MARCRFLAVPIFNGLDWFWGLSALGAWRFWRRVRPQVVVLQWWTATVLHSYLALAFLAKRAGARLVIEFHEVQDVGEASLPLVSRYTRAGMRLLLSRADAITVHSEFDRLALRAIYPELANLPSEVTPVGHYERHAGLADADGAGGDAAGIAQVQTSQFACSFSVWSGPTRATLNWPRRSVCSLRPDWTFM